MSDKLTNLFCAFIIDPLWILSEFQRRRSRCVMISGPDQSKDESEKELPGLQTRGFLEYHTSKKSIVQ